MPSDVPFRALRPYFHAMAFLLHSNEFTCTALLHAFQSSAVLIIAMAALLQSTSLCSRSAVSTVLTSYHELLCYCHC